MSLSFTFHCTLLNSNIHVNLRIAPLLRALNGIDSDSSLAVIYAHALMTCHL